MTAEMAEFNKNMAKHAPSLLPQINVVEYSVEEFAKSLKKFYDALIEEGVSVPFAERLTVAFCQRP